jgi:hypothetical protein
MNEIHFTPAKIARFREIYQTAVEAKAETFRFEGHEVLTDYAKYMLEYLDGLSGQSTKKEI